MPDTDAIEEELEDAEARRAEAEADLERISDEADEARREAEDEEDRASE